MSEIAQVYSEVFAGPPWLEVSKCSTCGSFGSSEVAQGKSCSCGGSFDVPAYPLVETTEYVRGELARQSALGLWLAVGTKELQAKGFGWGYGTEAKMLARQKYKTDALQSIVRELLVSSGAFFYISEVGVLPSLQGEGWGKALTSALIDGSKQYSNVVLRTSEDSPMRYISEKLGMKPVMGLQSGVRDDENEARVLFVGKR